MTTLKGFVRSTTAGIDRFERAHQQRVRYAAKIEKLKLKEEALANAALAVKKYNELITLLTSIHKESIESIDWQEILDEPAPPLPVATDRNEQAAIHHFKYYTPSFFDKLFGAGDKKKARLEQNITVARNKDKTLFEQEQTVYAQYQKEWEDLHELAKGVINKDATVCRDAVVRFYPFADVMAMVSSLTLTFHSNYVIADILVKEDDILPRQVLTLTSTGKLSKKDMPVSKFNELYQDHVCSCLLHVGREITALLPVEFVIVNTNSDLLNPSTGLIEQQTIVSAAIFPANLAHLNFATLDPSDSMKNFKHVMEFSKASGFRPVDPLEGSSLSPHRGIGTPVRLSIDPANAGSIPALSHTLNALDEQVLNIYKQQGPLQAVKFYKDQTKSDLVNAKNHVDKLAAAHGLKKPSGGCAGMVVVLLLVIVGICLLLKNQFYAG